MKSALYWVAVVSFSLVVSTFAGISVPLALKNDGQGGFNLRGEMTGRAGTLHVWAQEYDPSSNSVLIAGVDWSRPGRPYTFDWGDGSSSEGEWPQRHLYKSRGNYVVTVTSHHPSLGPATNALPVRFAPSSLKKAALPEGLRVTILSGPESIGVAGERQSKVDYFGPAFFKCMPRADVEYVLTAAACVQYDLSNGDIFLLDGRSFSQVIYREGARGGMSSHWDFDPVAFVAGDYAFKPPMQYSSFFHEMGHNFNLNSPAGFRYGGRANGCASSIYTETLAQIMQYATARTIINHRDFLGLDDFTVEEIKASASDHVRILREHHEQWVAKGMRYESWDSSKESKEDVTGTFMTLACAFIGGLESSGRGCRVPVKRLMGLLQCFNDDWRIRWGRTENSTVAESFRATLMVAAISYGLERDMRDDFKKMHYPIDDKAYSELLEIADRKYRSKKGTDGSSLSR